MSTTPALADILADRAQDTVVKSVKVVAATGCPAHPSAMPCSCPAAMATMTPSDHAWCKRIWCCMVFENEIIGRDHAWTYIGDKASHDIFTTAEGMTPKHFIREQIQRGSMKLFMAPSGKLNDTIQALLELWIARNKQWREKYGTLDLTREKWMDDAYPDAPVPQIVDLKPDTEDIKAGDMVAIDRFVPAVTLKMESPHGEHHFDATFSRWHAGNIEGRTPYGTCVAKVEYCHPGCEIGERIFAQNVEEASKRALELLEGRQDEFKLA